ncbi:nucleotide disphospho-sugar-binding domain-containing protein [Mycobacterium sp.]|uniref:nucleotide disphospho-sugar-binding domain-containing protein n=1 Tax=Mycobacterium sp. TaxID=1785 RepID=UPI0025CEE63F|nr:nucleotide disphospho-sugar-binding domain-containing protein [Mycobacterium sp.]
MAHYLLAAGSIPGHLTPLLELGGDLVRRGHEVTFLADGQYRDAISERRMRHHPLPATAAPRPQRPSVAAPGLMQRFLNGRQDMSSVFIAPMAAQWNALRQVLEDQCVDAMLCDIAFTGVLPLLLSPLPRPRVVVGGVSPLMLSSCDTPPFGMGWQPKSFDYRRMNQVVSDVLFRGIRSRLDDALRSVGAAPMPVFLTDWPLLADHVLQLSIPGLEYPRRDLPATVTFAGPVVPQSVPLRRADQRRVGTRTVVHVTQGTWDNGDLTELVIPTVQALGSRADTVVVATTGRRGRVTLPITLPRNVFVTDYVPYAALLPVVDVMVTNGGFGGVQHALSHGIPLVVAGATSDKPEVAARVAHAGAGIDLRTSRPKRRDLSAAIDQVLSQPRFRNSAERLGREMQCYNAFDHVADVLAKHPASTEHVS